MAIGNALNAALAQADDYAGVGKPLEDEMYSGVQYGNPYYDQYMATQKALAAQRGQSASRAPAYTMPANNTPQAVPSYNLAAEDADYQGQYRKESNEDDVDARIEELNKQIAALQDKIKNFDGIRSMADYKFLYEGDMSPELTYEQMKRNEKQIEEQRKASAGAMDGQTVTTAYKQAGLDAEAADYALQDAQNEYNRAVESNDPDAIEKAGVQLGRAQAQKRRADRTLEEVSRKAYELLGISPEASEQDSEAGSEDYKGAAEKARAAKNYIDGLSAIESLDVNKAEVSKEEKKRIAEANLAQINDARKNFEANKDKFTLKQQGEIIAKLQALENANAQYSAPPKKGGKGTTPKPTTDDDLIKASQYANGGQMTTDDYVAKGVATLKKWKAAYERKGKAVPENLKNALTQLGA